MSFTFPVDSNNKAGAVRLNQGGTGFHVPSVLYGSDGVTPSRIKKVKKVYSPNGLGYAHVISAGQELTILENHEFDAGTGSWGLSFTEVNRPTSGFERVKIRVIMHDNLNPTGKADSGGEEYSFIKTFEVSLVDEVDKALGIFSENSDGRLNVILNGKPFNVPMGKYLTVTIINNLENPDIFIKGFTLIEYGWF